MSYKFIHNSFNVKDLNVSLAFYKEALELEEQRRVTTPDGSLELVFLGNEHAPHQLELTWVRDRIAPYDLGDNEFHLALQTDNYEISLAKHTEMGCVSHINEIKSIYYINDPDGYVIEIVPKR